MIYSVRVTPLRDDSVSSIYMVGSFYPYPLAKDTLEVIERKESKGEIPYIDTLEGFNDIFFDAHVMEALKRAERENGRTSKY